MLCNVLDENRHLQPARIIYKSPKIIQSKGYPEEKQLFSAIRLGFYRIKVVLACSMQYV
jgi:hypothetical protein